MQRTVLITVLLVLSVPLAAQAQGVYVYCARDIDGAKVQADSIRIECVEYGIDSIVQGSVFELPPITAVREEGPLTHEYIEYELFDLRGCALGRHRSAALEGGLQWLDQIGVVYVQPVSAVAHEVSTSIHRPSKSITHLFGLPQLRITAWRAGYVSATTTCSYPTSENVGVHLVLELRPWWERLVKVYVVVEVPQVQWHNYGQQGHGGTGWSWDDHSVTTFTFDEKVGYNQTPAGLNLPWGITGATAKYWYSSYEYGSGGAGSVYTSTIEYDSTTTFITAISVKSELSHSPSRESGEIRLAMLPPWGIQTPGRLEIHLVDSVADACLRFVYHHDYESNCIGPGGFKTTDVGPHIPTAKGTKVGCTIFLRE